MAIVQRQVPQKVQTIGILHLIGGILNLITALAWGLYGLVAGLATFGIGLMFCCPAIILLPVGIMEIISGSKHLSSDHSGLGAPKLTAIAEVCSILGCAVIPTVFGVLTLVFMSDPEVEEYYAQNQLMG